LHFDFWVVLIYLAVCAGIVGFALLLARFVSPRLPSAEKATPYECGERPIGSGWFSFNPRFYLMALVFIVFDVEIALTYPVATVVRSWVDAGKGATAVGEILIFIAILAAALAYVWGKGDLDWVRDVRGSLADTGAPADPCGRRSAEDS
jgi:NADH-quinone oxidoreductase subunit A